MKVQPCTSAASLCLSHVKPTCSAPDAADRYGRVTLNQRWFVLKPWMLLPALVFALVVQGATRARAQQVETSLPPSDRVTIDLSAGMPGQSHWLYIKDQDSASFAGVSFNDSAWTPVGIPHGANYFTSFLNVESGGGDGDLNGGNNWYRLHFKLGTQYANSKVMVEFEGAHTAAQVYINGTLLPGISTVPLNSQASHVIGFIPFIVDLTPYLHTDGVTDNVLAVSVSRNNSWFEQPTFSGAYRFGQAEAGLFRSAYMFITNKVHIPVNVYSNQKTWGTYVATVSEVPSDASTAVAASAVVEVQTNVVNETTSTQQVTLTTQIVDANGNVVAVAPPETLPVPPMTPASFPSTATPMFDQKITVNNPTLWYPNNSTFGTPYMYRVYHIVSVDGVVVDSAQSPLGIRTITWDRNFPYFNGHPMFLWGASGRYDYPALGSSVPEELQWRDLAQFAAAGGNIWRPGHSTSSEEFVNAADQYGIMIDQPSGDGEEAFATPPADDVTLKEELHRDMIIRDRSHPSILDWESNNGTMAEPIGIALLAINQTWDPINTRQAADRSPDPVNGYILGCTLQGCEVGIKNQYPDNPAWGSEYWGNGTARGLAYDYELAFAAPFLDNWRQGRQANAFGMAQWYFADTPGETGLYAEYQQYLNTPQQATYESSVRGLGDSMVDMNRFPKMLYYIYQAAWTPFALKPVVHLAHHWNRAYQGSGPIQVNAFSNCPYVRLLINGVQQGQPQTPNSWESNSSSNLTQSTTMMPFQTSWSVNWISGTVEADCLDEFGNVLASDTKTTAGPENKIVLSVVPDVVRPDGTSFAVTANGSDVALITAQVEDANGNIVPTAGEKVTFSVNGPATYLGGTEQYVANGSDAYSTAPGNSAFNYHAPGDPELQFEGGLTRVAVMSQFTAAPVTVTASAAGLATGSVTYNIQPVPSFLPAPSAPAIILPPVSTAVTVGQPAMFSVTATGTAPLTFQWSKDGAEISGATGSSYIFPATTLADDNSHFTVKVTNDLGPATSDPVTLQVVPAQSVAITNQPLSQTAYVGQTALFTVAATGSPTVTYQWQKNGIAIPGATASSYTTPVLAANNNGDSYTVIVTNPVNSITSTPPALLTVDPAVAPTITQSPTSLSVLANNPATFTVTASGSAPFTYQWQLNGANLLGANAATFSIFQVQPTDVGNYTVTVTNAAGSATSTAATLTIAPPGVNLALKQPATSSSVENGGLGPQNVNDGNLTTRWGSAIGVDPSWVEIDLGSLQSFDNVILHWENAYATKYQILYSTDDTNWSNVAYTNNDGVGGVENLTFPTVQGRYVRMNGEQRATQYGYSLFEFEVYNVAQCGSAGERYSILSNSTVLDNSSGLTWKRAENTYTGANSQGAQYTQSVAGAYCQSQGMRLPTQTEALTISGANSALCAFPQPWGTWTSTINPANSNDAAFVTYAGKSSWQVADNFPGAVMCDSGGAGPAPTITTQPIAQTVTIGQSATFSAAASGTAPLMYQWYENGSPVAGATAATYTTPATTATDNGALFSVAVTNAGGTILSNSVALTVISGAGGTQDFTLVVSPATIKLTAGGSGTTTITVTPQNGFPVTSTVVFACSGLPTGVNCSFSPVTASAGNLVSTLTLTASATAATTAQRSSGTWLPGTILASVVCLFVGRKRNIMRWFLLVVVSVTLFPFITACGGSSTVASSTGGGTSAAAPTVTVTATSGSLQHTATISVSVSSGSSASAAKSHDHGPAFPSSPLTAAFCFLGIRKRQYLQRWLFLIGALSTVALFSGCGASTTAAPASATSTAAKPAITTQPVSQTVTAGQAAIFSVVASSAETMSYQWQKNNQPVSGATSASYTTAPATAQDNGASYSVVITNAEGSVTSGAAVLTVTGASCSSAPGAPGTVTATATSGSQVSLNWAANAANSACAVTYSVYRSTTSGFSAAASNQVATGVAGTSFADTGLSASTNYYYLVEAVDGAGTSAPSTQAVVTTLASTGPIPAISTQPAGQAVTIGTTATFSVTADGVAPLTYQWRKNNVAIPGATSAAYYTPATSAPDDGSIFSVVVSNSNGSTTSGNATLSVNSSPAYAMYPGFIGTDLNNNTRGAWADDKIYVEILGADITTGALSWVNYDGTVKPCSLADNSASGAVTGPNGQTYPNYAFTLAQSNHLLKLPPLNGGRIYISLGAPMYIPIMPGNPLGYAGPNPLNTSDPNSNIHYDWYEFDWGGTSDALFINTTQVDMFGLPLTLDVWGTSETFHQQTGITESIAAIDQEFASETPAIFQATPISPLRIWAPEHISFGSDGPNGSYFDNYVNAVWSQYSANPLTVWLNNNSRKFTGTTTPTAFNFTEVDLGNGAYAGTGTYTINKPTTQDILLCAGSMATGSGVTAALEAQMCAAFNRHVMDNYTNWDAVASYYLTAPANYYSAFWHRHSIAELSYGFAYDDVNNQSSSIVGAHPEHMAFGIGW